MNNDNLKITRNREITAPTAIALACAIAMQSTAFAQTMSVNDVIQSDTMRAVATQSTLAQAAYALATETSDTDADNVPEPLAMATGTGPTGGGVIPAASGAPKTDAFGRALGYCAFDIGATNASTNRISGAASPSPTSVVFAVVSAGIDGAFNSSCATLGSGGAAAGDDLVVTYNLLQVRMGMGGSLQWGNSTTNLTELNWLATNAAAQLRDGEVRLRRDTSQVYRWNSAISAWSLVNASPWTTSGTTVSYTSGDVQVSNGVVSAAGLRETASGYAGNFGSIAASWGGSTSYPTLYSDHGDRWVMHINPHVAYTQPGANGFAGSMTGATIRMASDAAATTYWDIGVGTNGVGADKFAVGRTGTPLLTVNSGGTVSMLRNSGAMSDGAYASSNLEIKSTDGSPTGIGFHRAGYSAVTLYHGGDGDNLLRLRRWAGGDYKVLHSGNAPYADAMNQHVRTTDAPTFAGMALTGDITVRSGGNWSTINMADADEGMRYVHNNSGTIGFLGSDAGWTMRVADDGNIWSKYYGDWLSNVMARRNSTNDFTSQNYFHSNRGNGAYLSYNNNPALQAYSNDGGAAFMSFHRGGYYAVNIGLDPDNVFRIGGWSAGANRLSLDMSGNLTVPGSVSASRFEIPGTNIPVGQNALASLVTGSANIAIGATALNSLNGYSDNVGIGNAAGKSIVGYSNIVIGSSSMSSATAATRNTAVGSAAMLSITSGDGNTVIGYQAGSPATIGATNGGKFNVALGTFSSIGDNLQYATALGAGASVLTSNTVALGRASDSVVVGGSSANPSYKFYVNGYAGGTTGWNTYSDARLKKNLDRVSADPLAAIMKLRPVSYEYRRDEFPDVNFATGRQIGFIAQDLEQIVPEVVRTGADGYKTVEYAPLTALITAGMQELQTNNVAMQQRVSNLESQNNEQSQLIQALQQQLMIEQSARLH